MYILLLCCALILVLPRMYVFPDQNTSRSSAFHLKRNSNIKIRYFLVFCNRIYEGDEEFRGYDTSKNKYLVYFTMISS